MESILNSIKKLLGIDESDNAFDDQLIVHINSVFSILQQIGVGPVEGFMITDSTAVWNDFIGTNAKIASVKTFVYLKVKLIFDPPTGSATLDSMKQMIDELQWRLNVEVDKS